MQEKPVKRVGIYNEELGTEYGKNTRLAKKRRPKQKGWTERKRPSLIQQEDRWKSKSPRKRESKHTRANEAQRLLSSEDGVSEGSTDERREEDPFETLARGMGALW